MEVEWPAKLHIGFFSGSCGRRVRGEDVKTFSKDTFEFVLGSWAGLGGPGGMGLTA